MKDAGQLYCYYTVDLESVKYRFSHDASQIAQIVSKMKGVNSDVKKYYIMKPQISKVEC